MAENILDSAADRQIVYDGLDISLDPAPFIKRILAYVVDISIETAVMYLMIIPITMAILLAKHTGNQWIIIGTTILVILFIVGFDSFYWYQGEIKHGATIGKKIFGLKVISLDGSQISVKQCLIRAGMRYVECFTILPCLISILLNDKKQRLGDLMSGTMVVYSATREKDKDFLYMDQDRYYMLEDAWKPKELDQSEASNLVAFAFNAILMASDPERYDAEKKKWVNILKKYVSKNDETDDEELLRFFAQRAVISDNDNLRRQ